MYEIRQNGQCVLQSKDEHSIPMFFNNLTGVNIKGSDYRCIYVMSHVSRWASFPDKSAFSRMV